MVAIGMRLTMPKIIGREACLQVKGLSRLLKILGPKRCLNTWRRDKSKEIRVFMKVGEGGVQRNRYNVCCT
jgi:hypothetical protein